LSLNIRSDFEIFSKGRRICVDVVAAGAGICLRFIFFTLPFQFPLLGGGREPLQRCTGGERFGVLIPRPAIFHVRFPQPPSLRTPIAHWRFPVAQSVAPRCSGRRALECCHLVSHAIKHTMLIFTMIGRRRKDSLNSGRISPIRDMYKARPSRMFPGSRLCDS
jgi:hypothetical protein